MSNFIPGQKLVCVEGVDPATRIGPRLAEIYTVRRCSGRFVSVQEIPGYAWLTHRFLLLVEPGPKRQD